MKKRGLAMSMALLIALSSLVGCSKKEVQKVEEKAVTVKTEVVKKGDILVNTRISGKLKPFDTVDIWPKVPGKISYLGVKLGQRVKKGQVLYKIEDTSVSNAVKSADVAYQSALVGYKKAKEQYDNAILNLERTKSLFEAGAATKEQVEQAELLASPTTLEISQSQIDIAKVSLENAKSMLSEYTVTAPISGMVTVMDLNQGGLATQGGETAKLTISNIDTLTMEAGVSETLINFLKKGQEVNIRIKTAGDEFFKARITQIIPTPTGKLNNYPIKIEVPNRDSKIKAGMFGEIEITTQSKQGIINIPSEAVVVKEGAQSIFIVKEGRAVLRKVKTGLDNGQRIEIIEGLNENEEVVIKGQEFLDDKSKVTLGH